MSENKIKVCVVGAGAAGLCATRHLSETEFDFDVYEKTGKIGGIWNYTDLVGKDENGQPIHTSMYKNLRTNLPMEIMEFQDFGSKCSESFVTHKEVLKYLEDYAKYYHLFKYIKIIMISRVDNFWKVLVKNIKTEQIIEKIYHSIIVCNGRYSKPDLPNDLKGIQNFRGTAIHSHYYRIPEPYSGQNVLVLGAGPSGIDISIELSDKAKQVVLCHRNTEMLPNLPKNLVQELSEILEIRENEVLFKSGNKIEINSIIFATGYRFDFSFMDQNCGISVNERQRVEGIYLHLINIRHPSMAILTIPYKVVPFPLFNQQVLLFIKSLTKEITLPSKEEMIRQTEEELSKLKSMGIKEKHWHRMDANLLFDYFDKLSKIANIESYRPVFRQIYTDLDSMRKQDFTRYKTYNFKIISNDEYIVFKPEMAKGGSGGLCQNLP